MKNRNHIFSFIILLLFSATNTVWAESSPRIAVVDLQSLLEKSIVGKAARTDLEGELKKRRASLEVEKVKLKKQHEDLKSQGMLLSKEALEERREKLMKAERDFQRKMRDMQEDMQRESTDRIEKIIEEAREIIEDIAEDRGYDFVLESSNRFVAYSDDSIDISDEVIKTLDKRKL